MLEGEFCCVLAFGWSRRDLFICQAGKLYCPCRCAGSIKWIHEPWPKKLHVRVPRVVASMELGQLGHRTHLCLLRQGMSASLAAEQRLQDRRSLGGSGLVSVDAVISTGLRVVWTFLRLSSGSDLSTVCVPCLLDAVVLRCEWCRWFSLPARSIPRMHRSA